MQFVEDVVLGGPIRAVGARHRVLDHRSPSQEVEQLARRCSRRASDCDISFSPPVVGRLAAK